MRKSKQVENLDMDARHGAKQGKAGTKALSGSDSSRGGQRLNQPGGRHLLAGTKSSISQRQETGFDSPEALAFEPVVLGARLLLGRSCTSRERVEIMDDRAEPDQNPASEQPLDTEMMRS